MGPTRRWRLRGRGSSRHGFAAAAAAAVLLLTPLASPRAQIGSIKVFAGYLVVTDRDADPDGTQTRPGAVFAINPGEPNIVYRAAQPSIFDSPRSTYIGRQKLLYVIDAEADPRGHGNGNGAIFRIDSRDAIRDLPEILWASPSFLQPVDLVVDERDRVVVLDQLADPFQTGTDVGAIFRIDAATQQEEVLATFRGLLNPYRLVRDLDGAYLILDRIADPFGYGGPPGAVYRLDPFDLSLDVLFSIPGFTKVSGLRLHPDGDYLLIDEEADPLGLGGRPGGVFRVDRETLTYTGPLAAHEEFEDPVDVAFGENGEVYVLDQRANPLGLPGVRGAVFQYDPASGEIVRTWASEEFRAVTSLTIAVGADLDSSQVFVTDLNGSPVLPGDYLRVRLDLRNTGTGGTSAVSVVDSLIGGMQLIGGTAFATGGVLEFLPEIPGLRWSGDMPRGAVYDVGFDVLVEEGGASILHQEVHASTDSIDLKLSWRVSVDSTLSAGSVVIGSPFRIHKLDRPTDDVRLTASLLSDDEKLVRPGGLTFTESGGVLVADPVAVAVPNQPGAIYLVNTATGQVTTPAAGLPLFAPSGIAQDFDGSVLVADAGRIPLFPNPEIPGAVFRLDPETDEPQVLFQSEEILHPADIVRHGNGHLFIADFHADPDSTGERDGAVFEVDTDAGKIVRTYRHSWFKEPVGLTLLSDGQIIVLDKDADPFDSGADTGALFRLLPEQGVVQYLRWDARFVDLEAAAQDTLGDLLIADSAADPEGFGFYKGAVWHLDMGSLEVTPAFHSVDVREIRAIAVRNLGDFRESEITREDTSGPPFLLGDTLRAVATLRNTGQAVARAVSAEFRASPALTVLSVDAERGQSGPLPGTDRVQWNGDLLREDSVRIEVLYRVEPDADVSFWEPLAVSLNMPGPLAPADDPVVINLVAPLREADHVVVDAQADPLEVGGSPGALFLVIPGEAGGRVLYSHPDLVDPLFAVLDSQGDVLILDGGATPGGPGSGIGALFRLDVHTGDLQPVFWSDSLAGAVELVPEPDGGYLIVDSSIQLSDVPGQRGAILRLASPEGPLEVVSTADAFRLPTSVVRAKNGDLYVADFNADPVGFPSNTGAVFRIDPSTGAAVDTIWSQHFVDPQDIDLLPDGRLVMTDDGADPSGLGGRTGTLFAIDPESGDVEVYAQSSLFIRPHRSMVTTDGTVLVVDRSAHLPGTQAFNGAVMEVHPATREVGFLAGMIGFVSPRSLLLVPFAQADIGSFGFTDLDLDPLDPGDILEYVVELINNGQLDESSAAFADTLPSSFTLIPGTLVADGGEIHAEGSVVRWSGPIPKGETITLRYRAALDPLAAQGSRLWRRVHVFGSAGARRRSAEIEHVVGITIDPGSIFVLDADADPLGHGLPVGALFKVSFPIGTVTTVASSDVLDTPIDMDLLSETARTFVIADAEADPLGSGRRGGALFLANAQNGEISLLAADTTFVEPVQVLAISETEVLLLDLAANPYSLSTPLPIGPGAIYRVSVPDGEVEIVYSDTMLVRPAGMALDGRGGLLVADEEADPTGGGGRGGAILRIDLDDLSVDVVATDPLFEDPARVVLHPSGDLLVLDRSALRDVATGARGAVFRVHDGQVTLHSRSSQFRLPIDLLIDDHSSVLVVDRNADPRGLGGNPGAVFRYDPDAGAYVTVVSSTQFRNPGSALVHMALTPVLLSSFEATVEDGAVVLRWSVTSDVSPEGYWVLRGPAGGDGPYHLLNPGAPVIGSGFLTYRDSSVEPGNAYSYLLGAIQAGGGSIPLGPVEVAVPSEIRLFALSQASPNPFRAGTAIGYSVPARRDVQLTVYDLMGRTVRRLADGAHDPGFYTAVWDGTNEARRRVASGVYFVRFTDGRQTLMRRLVVLR